MSTTVVFQKQCKSEEFSFADWLEHFSKEAQEAYCFKQPTTLRQIKHHPLNNPHYQPPQGA